MTASLLALLLALGCLAWSPGPVGAKNPVLRWKATALDHLATYQLKDLVATKSKAKQRWKAKGDCTIVAKELRVAASGSCKLTVSVDAKGRYPKAKLVKSFTLLVCSTGGTCSIGDTGPGTGIVYYDAGSTQSWGRYLEAAPQNLPGTPIFGCSGTRMLTGNGIGDGKFSTAAILSVCSAEGTAAKLAKALRTGGKADWFVPSLNELEALYQVANTVGGLGTSGYWSSSEYSDGFGWFVSFVNGGSASYGKDQGISVRPIRAFKPAI